MMDLNNVNVRIIQIYLIISTSRKRFIKLAVKEFVFVISFHLV